MIFNKTPTYGAIISIVTQNTVKNKEKNLLGKKGRLWNLWKFVCSDDYFVIYAQGVGEMLFATFNFAALIRMEFIVLQFWGESRRKFCLLMTTQVCIYNVSQVRWLLCYLLLCGFLLSSTFFIFSSILRFHSLQLHSGYGSCARMGSWLARRSTGTIPAVHTSKL